MSILNDIKYSFLKVSKLVVDKTGDYSRIARLTLDIKNYEGDIDKKQIELGKLVLERMEKGDSSIDLNDSKLQDTRKAVDDIQNKIKMNREEIGEIKSRDKNKEAG